MLRSLIIIIILILAIPACSNSSVVRGKHSSDSEGNVLLISFDSFRWDFTSKTHTPNFDYIKKTGVKAPYVQNVYPTATFPNHYTIVTGLYPDEHGIIANSMRDPLFNTTFNMDTVDSKWWEDGEPIWVTNQRQGFTSGNCYWPGYNVKIRGEYPSYSTRFMGYNNPFSHTANLMPWKERIDFVISWLSQPNPPSFVSLYFEEPDDTSHGYGPESPQVKEMIGKIDQLMGFLLKRLKDTKLINKVNILVTADHGQITMESDRIINVRQYVDPKNFELWGASTCLMVWPHKGKSDEVYKGFLEAQRQMGHLTVYKREDIPDAMHFKHHRRIPPLLVVPEASWEVVISGADFINLSPKEIAQQRHIGNGKWGVHGYNISSAFMWPFFVARGPAFKEGYLSQPFESVDLYPLICHILGINPAPNSGSFARVKNLLRSMPYS